MNSAKAFIAVVVVVGVWVAGEAEPVLRLRRLLSEEKKSQKASS